MSPYVRVPAVEPADRRAAVSIFLILLAIYTATFSGLPDNPDAEVEFQTTRSLVQDRSFALGDTPEALGIIEHRFNVVPGGPGREQRFYSWHGVGQALVGVPFYLGGALLAKLFPQIEARHAETWHRGYRRSEYFSHLAVGWRNPLLSALTAGLILLTARRLRVRRIFAWVTALSYGLCSFAWPQARSTLSDVQATFFVFLAFHQLALVRECMLGMRSPSLTSLVVLGFALGSAVLTRVAIAPVCAVLFIACMLVLLSGRRLLFARADSQRLSLKPALGFWMAALWVGPILCAGLFFYTNQERFGSVLESGYGVVLRDGTFFSYPPWLGLAGLLLAPGKGLLWMAPAIALAPLAFFLAIQRQHVLWPWTMLCVSLACMAPIVCTQTWHGAYTYGPRYVLPMVPICWLAVGYVLEARGGRAWTRPALWGLLILGALVQLPAALVDHRTHQDLAVQAARLKWPSPETTAAAGVDEARLDENRFMNIQWDWGFAAPWAHWRILRHKVAGLGEEFPVRDTFNLDSDAAVTPGAERERAFNHLAWVDLDHRLGGRAGPAVFLAALLLGIGCLLAIQSLERAAARGPARP
jgi:hypothetical protein